MNRRFLAAALLLCTATLSTGAQLESGSWLGWAYLDDGNGDLPLRVQVDAEGQAVFDGVVWRDFGWDAAFERDETGQLVLRSATGKGTPIRLAGSVEKDEYAGSFELGDYHGRFVLLRAVEPVLSLDPQEYADVAGYYAMDDGDVLHVRARDWGELVVRSLRSGQQRCLLPGSAADFWTGPAMYDPRHVESRFRVERDTDGSVIALERDGRRGRRFDLSLEDVHFVADGDTLAGLLTRIDDERRREGIVFVGGSSWRERNDHGFQVRNLAALGYCVLSYDKRGFGESGGTDPVAFERSARDALAGARWLRTQDAVDAVGYVGVSRGAWIVPIACELDSEAAFAMLFVPPATSPAEQEHSSRLARMAEDGFDADALAAAERMLEANWAYSGGSGRWEDYAQRVEEARAKGVPDYVFGPTDADPAQWEWARLNMRFDPTPYLRRLRVPVLAIFGELDSNVLTQIHRPRLAAALEAAGNRDVTLVTIAGVDHGLGRSLGQPSHLFTGVGPEGFDAVMDWISKRSR